MSVAIRVENLGKQFRIGSRQQKYVTMRDTLAHAFVAPFKRVTGLLRGDSSAASNLTETFWALKDVSFEVNRGEVIGIIGHNGAGKSTLLKILTRITEPTEGTARIRGRVSSLLEVGTGFHPELTGRENVYLNAAILGMTRSEIESKFDEIVAFAETEKFVDTPVKHYSSGMYLRLAFAVAAHLEPEILLIDEVLAVGDANFQKKCLGKMSQIADQGRTVLFVSHNMPSIQTLCSRAVLLSSGRLVYDGTPQDTIDHYLKTVTQSGEAVFGPDTPRKGSGGARITKARLLNERNEITNAIPMGEGFTVEMEFEADTQIMSPGFSVLLSSVMKGNIAHWVTDVTEGELPPYSQGGTIRLFVKNLNLLPGTYYLALSIDEHRQERDMIENALELEIAPRAVYATGKIPSNRWAMIFTPCSWEFDCR